MIARHPSIPRTGETELHQMGNLLERHAHRPFYATEKLDGFSFSFGWLNGEFIASARDRMIALNEDSVFAQFLRSFPVRELPDGFLFQGELVGPGIRGNRYELDCLQFFAFDVLKGDARLSYAEAKEVCDSWKIATVPLLAKDFSTDADLCLVLSRNSSRLNPAVQREGAVFRPMVETTDEFQGRVSFKVFNPAFKP